MCGLVAIWDPKGRVDPGQIDAALDHLSHRGPDGRGVALCHGGAVGLGHVRLSVIDLEGGAQPLSCDDGRIQAVVNGEFYGFEAIRSTLRARGHHFTTDSDSEVLLHLYREYGDACVDHLRGEFAFALWDGRRRRLLAARDRFGVKPLCYTVHRGRLILTSEAKALKAFSVTPTWDQSSLLHACRHQYLPPRRTLFADVSQVPPGHLLVHDGGAPRLRRYWDLDLPVTVEEMSDEAARVSVLEGLREAVRRRLRADVPVAFHLSGGLDSASTLALAAEAGYGPLHAFTVSFGVADYDELGLAETTAAHLGATLHPVHVGQGDLLEALPEAVYFSEGLAINGQLPAKLLLSRAVRDAGFKVTLSGEGADEALLGYPHLQQDALSAAEDPAHRALLNRHHRLSKGIMLPVGEGPDLPSTAARLGYVPTFLSAKAQFGARLTALLTDDAQAQIARRDPLDITLDGLDIAGQLTGRPPVSQSAYLWTKLALAGYILRTLGDGTEMASGVEGRTPFLDHRLHARLRALPLEQKLRNGASKFALRGAMERHLPAKVVRRPKHPFLAPPVAQFSTPSAQALVQDRLRSESMGAVPLFDMRRIRRFADALYTHPAGTRAASEPILMTLLSASLVQSRLMER